MVMQKRAIAGCALLLASSAPSGEAFSPMQSFSIRRQLEGGRNNNNGNGLILMANFPPPMDGMGPGRSMGGRSMGRRSMGGPPPGRGGMGPGPMDGPGGPGGPMGGPGMGGPSMGMNARPLPRQGGGGGGGNMGGQQSYNANSASPNGSNGNNAGNSPENQQRGLGAIASGVSTPMDKYGNPRSPERPRRPGGYSDQSPRGVAGGFDERGPGPDPRFDDRGGDPRGGDPRGGVGGGRPQNLRYEERDYGEYVTNLRSGPGAPEPRRGGGGGGGDIRDLEDEVERLRKENAMLKRSCQDLMNNFNEMSNRLFDVDESLKKVAKVFPSDDEMESLEWLLRR